MVSSGKEKSGSVILTFSDSPEWKRVMVSLDAPTSVIGEPRWSEVSKTGLGFDAKDGTGSLRLDEFTLWDAAMSDDPEEPFPWVHLETPIFLQEGVNQVRLEPSGNLWLDVVAPYSAP